MAQVQESVAWHHEELTKYLHHAVHEFLKRENRVWYSFLPRKAIGGDARGEDHAIFRHASLIHQDRCEGTTNLDKVTENPAIYTES